jgi:hypothetical protein
MMRQQNLNVLACSVFCDKEGTYFTVQPLTSKEAWYTVEWAAEIMRKVRGRHLVYISQWLKFGGDKLFTVDSGMQTFS